ADALKGVDVLVVDEASMVDTPLMAAVARAAEEGGVRTVLLVGDADQLPPVGPGQPFRDLLETRAAPVVRLVHVHRQAAESGVVRAAHAVRRGKSPEWSDDCRLIETPNASEIPGVVHRLLLEAPFETQA